MIILSLKWRKRWNGWNLGLKNGRNALCRTRGCSEFFGDKAFLKDRYFLLECNKIVSKFNLFSRKDLVFKAGVSSHDLTHGVARITGKEGIVGYTLKACTLFNAEVLGKKRLLDVFLGRGWIFITCEDLWFLLLGLSDEYEETFTFSWEWISQSCLVPLRVLKIHSNVSLTSAC